MTKKQKVPVTLRALLQRINRALKPNEMLKTTRGERWRNDVGDFFVIDFKRNWITHKHVDPEAMARDMEVLKPWETVEQS